MKQSEIRYCAIVEDQTEFIARYLLDGIITFVNQAYALYFGRSPEELIGSCYQPIIFEADRERVAQLAITHISSVMGERKKAWGRENKLAYYLR